MAQLGYLTEPIDIDFEDLPANTPDEIRRTAEIMAGHRDAAGKFDYSYEFETRSVALAAHCGGFVSRRPVVRWRIDDTWGEAAVVRTDGADQPHLSFEFEYRRPRHPSSGLPLPDQIAEALSNDLDQLRAVVPDPGRAETDHKPPDDRFSR